MGAQTPAPQLGATYRWGAGPPGALPLTLCPRECAGSVWELSFWASSCPVVAGRHGCSVIADRVSQTGPGGRRAPGPSGTTPPPHTRQLGSRGPPANLLLGRAGGDVRGPSHPLLPGPRPGPERREALRLSWRFALPGAAARLAHPPRRKSSLRASSASSRSPPADSRPGPSSPRAAMSAAARRPELPRGLGRPRPQWPRAGIPATPAAAGR